MPSIQQQHAQRWESHIRKQCRTLLKGRRALVDKNWEAPKVPGKQIKREKSKPDFSGLVLHGPLAGRHVVFEAKATMERERFDFSLIQDHQAEHLSIASTGGALSFVYVLDGFGFQWVLPWPWIQHEMDLGIASLQFDDWPSGLRERGETWLDVCERLDAQEVYKW